VADCRFVDLDTQPGARRLRHDPADGTRRMRDVAVQWIDKRLYLKLVTGGACVGDGEQVHY